MLGMLYADDAGIVSRSRRGLERIIMVTVTACSCSGVRSPTPPNGDKVLADKRWGEVSFTITAACYV